ncbi:hypothetical protein I4U23_022943 [Adineta vaga]|nr:hypothetical protein I4U23_022943 [Adineta vaga]
MDTLKDFYFDENYRPKFALVIGNSTYNMGDHLPNSINNAKQMCLSLKQIGFDILDGEEQINLNLQDFQRILEHFIDSIEENDLVVFYYSGYGRQWNNRNYLIPIDNSIQDIEGDPTSIRTYSGSDLESYAIDLEDLLETIHAKKPFASVCFLESSKLYSFHDELCAESRNEIYPKGFTSIRAEINSFVVFSCSLNQITNNDSLFTRILLTYLQTPNKDIRWILFRVQYEVDRISNSKQVLYLNTNLTHKMICLFQQNSILKRRSNQNAQTVAGGNRKGYKLNQLDGPRGIFVDEQKNIYITDSLNHRIVQWKYNEKHGQILAGGGDRIYKLNNPKDVVVDEFNHSVIIADCGNRRVVRWFNKNYQEILIENINCYGLAMDKFGFLYVSDCQKNEVRRWKIEEKEKVGTLVAGGKGNGDKLNQLSYPTYIFVDEEQSVYVSDTLNHRVMKWRKDAKEGIIVAGGNGEGNDLDQLFSPAGLFVDQRRQIYICDCANDRIMRWLEGQEEGAIVVGENGEGSQANQLYSPYGLSFDLEGNLYVADSENNRIQKFEKLSGYDN